jgi:hypothetical protein
MILIGIAAIVAVGLVIFLIIEDDIDRARHNRIVRGIEQDLTGDLIYRRRRP